MRSAPVNAPRSWPKRVDSIRFSGIAPQLMREERPALARARLVQGAGDHLLARAGFAGDQHGRPHRRGPLDDARRLSASPGCGR